MEISRDAILRIVRSARMAMKISDGMKALCGVDDINAADEVVNELAEVIYEIVDGKLLKFNQDFMSTDVLQLLFNMNKAVDETVDDMMKLYDQNHPAMPKPNLVSRDKLNEMLGNCGYQCGWQKTNAEGVWID